MDKLETRFEAATPLLGKGGVDATLIKMSRSLLCWSGRGGLFKLPIIGGLTKPPRLRELWRLREVFFIAQPPLLGRGGEYACSNVVRPDGK